jgi:hypothetical protein
MAITKPASEFFPYFADPPLNGPVKPILIVSAPHAGIVRKKVKKTTLHKIIPILLFMASSFNLFPFRQSLSIFSRSLLAHHVPK